MLETTPKRLNGPSVDKERQSRILVRVSPQEKRKFEKVAEKRYTNLSELVRQLLHREADLAEKA